MSEIEDLKELINNLNKNLNESKDKIKLLDKENEYMQDEYSKALDRNNKLLGELKEKENEYKNKSQELSASYSLKSEENLQNIQNLNNELEFQSDNFKEKLKQLNIQNMQTISMLQQQLEESKEEIDKLNKEKLMYEERANAMCIQMTEQMTLLQSTAMKRIEVELKLNTINKSYIKTFKLNKGFGTRSLYRKA